MNLDLILVFLYSYLLGSIPFGLIVTKIFLKKDIRNIGSGNIGATNVLRTGKRSLAVLTLSFDVFKGYFSIFLTSIYFNDLVDAQEYINLNGMNPLCCNILEKRMGCGNSLDFICDNLTNFAVFIVMLVFIFFIFLF